MPPSTTVQKYRLVCAWNGPRSPDCPDPDVVVLEPQPGADIEVARRRVELGGVLGTVERVLVEDGGCHGGLLGLRGCGQCPGSCRPKMSRGSPGRSVPVNC